MQDTMCWGSLAEWRGSLGQPRKRLSPWSGSGSQGPERWAENLLSSEVFMEPEKVLEQKGQWAKGRAVWEDEC